MGEGKFVRGQSVIFYAPDIYHEHKLGVILEVCKIQEDSFDVIILDETAPIKKVCVKNNRDRDTIIAVGD